MNAAWFFEMVGINHLFVPEITHRKSKRLGEVFAFYRFVFVWMDVSPGIF